MNLDYLKIILNSDLKDKLLSILILLGDSFLVWLFLAMLLIFLASYLFNVLKINKEIDTKYIYILNTLIFLAIIPFLLQNAFFPISINFPRLNHEYTIGNYGENQTTLETESIKCDKLSCSVVIEYLTDDVEIIRVFRNKINDFKTEIDEVTETIVVDFTCNPLEYHLRHSNIYVAAESLSFTNIQLIDSKSIETLLNKACANLLE